MKIVTWNCGGAFRKKFEKIATLEADVYVIQECENPEGLNGKFKGWAANSEWIGKNKHKGLGIFAGAHVQVERLNWPDENLLQFLPVQVDRKFNLIGAWTKANPTFRYIGQLWRYLQLHEEKIRSGNTILCGDLNSNKIWDEPGRAWNHSEVIKVLESFGMVSAYHASTGEEQGAETLPTLYLQRNLKKPYHIDYAFSNERMFNCKRNTVSIGKHQEWLEFSDHMPLTFTVDCGQINSEIHKIEVRRKSS